MTISQKIDDMTIGDLLKQAEVGNDWARRAAWAKVIAAREAVRDGVYRMIAGDGLVAKTEQTIANATDRLKAIG